MVHWIKGLFSLNNTKKFSFKTTNEAFASKASGEDIGDVLQYFYNKMKANKTYSVNDVFDGMTISQGDWSTYKK